MTTPNDEGTRLHRVAAAALGLVSLVYAVLFLALLPPRLAAPTAISAIEPQPVAGALRVARGEILYRDFFAERPVLPLTYGALPYWITGKSARLIGSTEPRQVMRVGRAITLFGTLAVTLLLAFLAFQRGVSVRWAGLACLPMFWFPYLAEWWVKFTPDAPALALSLAGWALLGPPDREQSGRFPARLVGAVLLWTLAFHFKPTVLAGPMGFGIERLVAAARARLGDPTRARRHVLFVVAAAVALLVGAVATAFALNLATGGFWKLNAIDAMGRGEFNPAFVLESLRSFRPAVLLYRLTPTTPVILGGVGIILLMIVWAIRRLRHQPLFAAFLLSILFDLVLMTKAGSNINYLMGSLTLWGLATVADAFPRGHSPRLPDAKLASLFACAIVLLLVLDIPRTRVLASEILLATPLELDHARQVVEALPPERLLVLDAVWGVPQGVPVPFADTYHAAMLEKEGMLVLTDLADALVERRFRVVIANRFATARAEYHGIPLLPASLRAALVEHYTPAQRGDWLVFWTPKPTEPVP